MLEMKMYIFGLFTLVFAIHLDYGSSANNLNSLRNGKFLLRNFGFKGFKFKLSSF